MFQHFHFKKCTSTQILLEDELKEDKNQELLFTSEHQNSGIGQRDASWASTHESLAISFTLQPHKIITLSSLEMGVICCEYFKKNYQVLDLGLKWPNDLYIGEKKVGGILIKMIQADMLIVGIGLNLKYSIEDDNIIPKNLQSKIGYLDIDIKNKKDFCASFYQYILEKRKNSTQIYEEWMNLCIHKDKKVYQKELVGIFRKLGPNGEAVIEDFHDSNKMINLISGPLLLEFHSL